MKVFQKGFNYSQDGPGNRLVYHIAGCNMNCLWCSNPEGMEVKENSIEYTPQDLVKEAESCKLMFFDGGGVTFTGGEATLNADWLIKCLKGLKEKGIHTAIETNGTSERLLEIAQYVDYLIMDFKHSDNDMLLKYTGMSGEIIKDNFEKICKNKLKCHIRIPLINEFNGNCAKEFAKYFSQYDTKNIVFEFLRYHEYGKEKWTKEYKITDGFISDETLNQYKKEFEQNNLKYIET